MYAKLNWGHFQTTYLMELKLNWVTLKQLILTRALCWHTNVHASFTVISFFLIESYSLKKYYKLVYMIVYKINSSNYP